MLKLLTIFMFYIKVSLCTGIHAKIKDKIKMDSGVTVPDPHVKPVQVTNSNYDSEDRYKLFLYQRVKLDLDQDSMSNLYFGLSNSLFTAYNQYPFRLDLGSDEVLINLNLATCSEEENCYKDEDPTEKKGQYKGVDFTFFDAKGFLGVNRIRPGEINVDNNDEITNFYNLPMKIYNNNKDMEVNVLGLAPKSPVWEYWKNIYHFPGRHINITLCYQNDFEYALFDSPVDVDKEIMFKIDADSNVFKFEAAFTMSEENKEVFNKNVNVCLSNDPGLTMKVDNEFFDHIKASLCKDPSNCTTNQHLKETTNFGLNLSIPDRFGNKSPFNNNFSLSSLYSLEGINIKWKFAVIDGYWTEKGCQVTLEKENFKDKYIMISKKVHDGNDIAVGFKYWNPADFSYVDFYSVTMAILIIGSIFLLIAFLILSRQLNKLIQKEAERQKEIA